MEERPELQTASSWHPALRPDKEDAADLLGLGMDSFKPMRTEAAPSASDPVGDHQPAVEEEEPVYSRDPISEASDLSAHQFTAQPEALHEPSLEAAEPLLAHPDDADTHSGDQILIQPDFGIEETAHTSNEAAVLGGEFPAMDMKSRTHYQEMGGETPPLVAETAETPDSIDAFGPSAVPPADDDFFAQHSDSAEAFPPPADQEPEAWPIEQQEEEHAQYEHQGETTAADSAVEEAGTLSLLQDEEAPPTPGWNAEASTTDQTAAQYEDMTMSRLVGDTEEQQAVSEQPAAAFEWGADDAGADADFESAIAKQHGIDEFDSAMDSFETRNMGKETSIVQQTDVLEEPHSSEPAAVGLDDGHVNNTDAADDDIAELWKAALGDDDLSDSQNALDPSTLFGDDGEGFLEDDAFPVFNQEQATPTQQPDPSSNSTQRQQTSSNQYMPSNAQSQRSGAATQHYGMPSPRFFESAQNPRPASTPSSDMNVYSAFGQSDYNASQVPGPQRPNGPQHTQSFVAQAKSGYASPYDLPMDIVKPRKRQAPPAVPNASRPQPPPRSSSMSQRPAQTPIASPPQPSSSGQFAGSVPPASLTSPPIPPQAPSATSRPSTSRSADGSGFFSDLPMTARPKSRGVTSSAYVPRTASGAPMPSPQVPPQAPPGRQAAPPVTSPPVQTFAGLQQPERLPLIPDLPSHDYMPQAVNGARPNGPPQVPPASSRFSPMPPAAPGTGARYSPAPSAQATAAPPTRYTPVSGLPSRVVQPFAPRTPSPLSSHHGKSGEAPAQNHPSVRTVSFSPQSNVEDDPNARATAALRQSTSPPGVYSPPRAPGASAPISRTNPYAPSNPAANFSLPTQQSEHAPPVGAQVLPPPAQRPRTQSPGAAMKYSRIPQVDRPTSAFNAAPQAVSGSWQTGLQGGQQTRLPSRRQFSADLSFNLPQDARAHDPLERFKGYPIFKWGASGALISSFPIQTPFYAAGHAIPTIRCTPGSVIVHDTKSTFPLSERDVKFPGPLSGKGKGKKKDVVTWLSGKIEDLERSLEGTLLDLDVPATQKTKAEEKVVLWKAVRVFVDNDNVLEGKPGVDDAIRKILVPNAGQDSQISSENTDDAGLRPVAGVSTAQAMAEIRGFLLEGQRERAVWFATEKHLWSHALLISSTMGPELWKQVVQEFVKSQVKSAGEDSQSLAALYEVFAGNWEESVDELVPPSARAGFQMVNKSDTVGSSNRNPLQGLDKWRETLALILSNRSANDGQAIAALGRLLAGYGRVEAAHTCFLFARTFVRHGGVDDPEANFVLLGADHRNPGQTVGSDLDSILLSEVYEYALSLTPAPGTSPVIPHLQGYKLMHAFELAEHGLRSEAQGYCEAIMSAVKSSTKASPYYHASFAASLEDFNRCLSQSPQSSSSSAWISKLSSDKVSGSMWKRFNTFVAGDDNDDSSQNGGSSVNGREAAGPFGKVNGETPTISRSASGTDLYGATYTNGVSSAPLGTSPGDYSLSGYGAQPAAGPYAPQYGQPHTVPLPSSKSFEAQRPSVNVPAPVSTGAQPYAPQRTQSTPYSPYGPGPQTDGKQKLFVPRPEASRAASDYSAKYSAASSRRGSAASYEPRPSMEQESAGGQPYQPTFGQGAREAEGRSESPLQTAQRNNVHQPPHSYEPSAGSPYAPSPSGQQSDVAGYGPPTLSREASGQGYAPLSQSYEPQSQSSQSHESPAQSYEPPSQSYEPPSQSYELQSQSYEAPSQSYDPPSQSYEPSSQSYGPPSQSYEAPAQSYEAPSQSYEPPSQGYEAPSQSYEPPSQSYEPPSQSYEPPASTFDDEAGSSGYQPSAYVPYEPDYGNEEVDPEADQAPKTRDMLNDGDDNDFSAQQEAARKAAARAQADKEANEAVRKAAEEDAARDKAAKDAAGKKGWFSGIWGAGKKDPNAPVTHKAKLGDERKLVYDEQLKRWVNKDGSPMPESAGSTPAPPPRGPGSRAASGAFGGPPSGPPSRVASGAGFAGGPPSSRPPTAGSGAMPPSFGGGSGPPSRIGTPLSSTGEGTRAAETSAPSFGPNGVQPPSRPPTSMSQASSIDDLIGAPQARKGGTVKGKKKGGRYVDVMAK